MHTYYVHALCDKPVGEDLCASSATLTSGQLRHREEESRNKLRAALSAIPGLLECRELVDQCAAVIVSQEEISALLKQYGLCMISFSSAAADARAQQRPLGEDTFLLYARATFLTSPSYGGRPRDILAVLQERVKRVIEEIFGGVSAPETFTFLVPENLDGPRPWSKKNRRDARIATIMAIEKMLLDNGLPVEIGAGYRP